MEIDNRIEAHEIGTRYLIIDSFNRQAQNSCHICPNSFRAGINLISISIGIIVTLYTSMKAAWEYLIPFWPQNFHCHFLMVAYPVLEFYMPL